MRSNPGRAPLSAAALDAARAAGGTPMSKSTSAQVGGRGAPAEIAEAVTDAGAVHVVNDNAAALLPDCRRWPAPPTWWEGRPRMSVNLRGGEREYVRRGDTLFTAIPGAPHRNSTSWYAAVLHLG